MVFGEKKNLDFLVVANFIKCPILEWSPCTIHLWKGLTYADIHEKVQGGWGVSYFISSPILLHKWAVWSGPPCIYVSTRDI